MKIKRILNNNAVLTTDHLGSEIIVLGKGIAFQKKSGELIQEDQVEKIFHLSNTDAFVKFQELVMELPLEYMRLSDEMIQLAETELNKKLNDSIYVSLSDHIYGTINRFKEGIIIKNALLWDIKRFYPDEYAIGLQCLRMIHQQFDLRLPDDEAGFIAFHFVNAAGAEVNQDSYKVTKLIQEITNLVRYYFKVDFNEESVYYYRFISHLKFFAQRLTTNQMHQDEHEESVLDIIKLRFPKAFQCVEIITQHINHNYRYELTDEEKMYLTIHIHRVIYKN